MQHQRCAALHSRIARKSSDLHSPASTLFSLHFIHAWRIDRRKVWQYFWFLHQHEKKIRRFFHISFFSLFFHVHSKITFDFNWISSCELHVAVEAAATTQALLLLFFISCELLVIANPLDNFITPIKLGKNDLRVQCAMNSNKTKNNNET